jgi:hypothetical protein
MIHTAEDNDQWLSVLNTILKWRICEASRHDDECVGPSILILSNQYKSDSRFVSTPWKNLVGPTGPRSLSGHSAEEKHFCPAQLRVCDCPPRSLATIFTELRRVLEFLPFRKKQNFLDSILLAQGTFCSVDIAWKLKISETN